MDPSLKFCLISPSPSKIYSRSHSIDINYIGYFSYHNKLLEPKFSLLNSQNLGQFICEVNTL